MYVTSIAIGLNARLSIERRMDRLDFFVRWYSVAMLPQEASILNVRWNYVHFRFFRAELTWHYASKDSYVLHVSAYNFGFCIQ